MDINKAFQYAYSAYAADKDAAYVLNTLASLHFDNNRVDSAIYYSKAAIVSAPMWRYPYVTLAYAYKSLGRVDSALHYYKKAVQVDPTNADAYVDLGIYFICFFTLIYLCPYLLYRTRILAFKVKIDLALRKIDKLNSQG